MGTCWNLPTINDFSKNKKNISNFYLKIISFIDVKYYSILYWRVFVMKCQQINSSGGEEGAYFSAVDYS